jgi:hypothetical protein
MYKNIVVAKSQERLFARLRCTKMILKEIKSESVDWTKRGPVAGSCYQANQLSASVKVDGCLKKLNDSYPLK